MKELQNPPSDCKEAYESVKELYSAYLEFTGMVIDPSGSLQSFSNDFNSADSEITKCYNAAKTYLNY